MTSTPAPADHLATFRRWVLAILVFAFVGTALELVLLEHFDGWRQWVPLLLLAEGAVVGTILLVRPVPSLISHWRLLMVVFVVAGGVGMWFHYAGNLEFELERTPDLAGLPLVHSTLEGATPVLAPGTLIQFGLLGLLFAWRHPLRRT